MGQGRRLRLSDVAEVAGVSVRTVSNVLNDFPHVRPETRVRVQAAVDQLGYRINPTARNLRRGSTGMLGLVVPEIVQPYFAELAEVVLVQARLRGYSLLIERTLDGAGADVATGHALRELELLTDGIVVSPSHLGPGSTPLDTVDVPVVAMTERLFDSGVDHVTIRDVDGARAAAAHLLAVGRRRVVALGTDPDVPDGTAALRERGHREAHAAAGVPFDEALLVHEPRWDQAHGRAAMLRALDAGLALDAVFAFNDTLAHGALTALWDRGVRVPQDVAVVGFDDVVASRYLNPPLTSISPGRAEAAERAVELLVARIDGSRTGPGEEFFTGFHLEVRGSSVADAPPAR